MPAELKAVWIERTPDNFELAGMDPGQASGHILHSGEETYTWHLFIEEKRDWHGRTKAIIRPRFVASGRCRQAWVAIDAAETMLRWMWPYITFSVRKLPEPEPQP